MPALLFFLACAVFAAPQWNGTLDKALAEAQATGKPVLMDFQAPWCYSCYYMEKHVLDGDAFAKASGKLTLLKLDVDTEEGLALKHKYNVNFLPSYVLLSSKREMLGRIVGEQTESDFLGRLDALLAGVSGDELARAEDALAKHLAAGEYDEAAGDIAAMKPKTLDALSARKTWQLLSARLELMRSAKAKWPGGADALKRALALDDSCASAYDIDYAEGIVDAQKPAAKKQILELERASLEKLADARLFVPAAKRCADFRTGVELLADVYGKLGDSAKREELLKKTVAFLDKQGLKPGEDRNFDDNRRYFLELLKDDAALASLYDELIKAYPSDYVYAYRWAKYQQENGKAREALPFIEKATGLAYGANRFQVAKVRAKIYAALGRNTEAVELLKRDAKSGRKAFPAASAELDALAKQLAPETKPPRK